MARNPEGHSPRYWRKHLPSVAEKETAATESTATSTATSSRIASFWGSTPVWSVACVVIGAIISTLSLRLLYFVAWAVFVAEFIRIGFFPSRFSSGGKVVGNVTAAALFAMCFLVAWRVTPKPKDPPTVDQQIDAFAKRFPWLSNAPTPPSQTIVLPKGPEHTRIDIPVPTLMDSAPFIPTNAGGSSAASVITINAGDYPVTSMSFGAVLKVINVQDVQTGFKKFRKSLVFGMLGGQINPRVADNYRYSPVVGDTLTASDITSLLVTHAKVLCAIGAVIWTDKTGKYETDLNDCLQGDGTGAFKWHVFAETNRELKIR